MSLRVTYYARVSTSSDMQLNSIHNQIKHFDEKIQENPNWTFIPGYVDEGISGISIKNREQFHSMVTDAKQGKFDLVLTKEISRFARNTVDSLIYTQELLQSGVGVFFESDNINTLEPDSEFRLTIMASIAQEEVRKLSERVKFGHKKSIESGHVLGNNRIFGYNYDGCKLKINPNEADMIKLIFELYVQGNSFRTITRILHEKGYKNRNGKPIHHNTLIGIIQNPKYKGYFCGGKVKIVDYRTKKQHFVPEQDWIMWKDNDGEIVPSIVSEELWEKANSIYNERKANSSVVGRNPYQKSPFTGKIICAEHGTPFYRNVYKYKEITKYFWYCKQRKQDFADKCTAPLLYDEDLEKIITVALRPILDNHEAFVNQYLVLCEKAIENNSHKAEISKIERHIEQIEIKKDRLLELSLDGNLSNAEFGKRNEGFNNEIKELTNHLDELMQIENDKNRVKKEAKKISTALRSVVNENRIVMDIACDLIEKIVVSKTDTEDNFDITVLLKTGYKQSAIYNSKEKTVWGTGTMFKKMMPESQMKIERINRHLPNHTYTMIANINLAISV